MKLAFGLAHDLQKVADYFDQDPSVFVDLALKGAFGSMGMLKFKSRKISVRRSAVVAMMRLQEVSPEARKRIAAALKGGSPFRRDAEFGGLRKRKRG